MLFDIVLILGAVGSFGSFVLLALTFWKSYRTDRSAEVVWERHPHERGE
jgi:uncharacterized membrane protein